MPRARMISFVSHAAVAALVAVLNTTAHAALVQITQFGNGLTPLSNDLDADLTGDGVPEVTLTGVTGSYAPGDPEAQNFLLYATVDGQSYSSIGGTDFSGNAAAGPGESDAQPLGISASISEYLPIVFTDPAYGVTGEDGWVEVFVRADAESPGETGIFLRRLVFDPESKGTPGFDQNVSYPEAQFVPEPGTGLVLASLALCLARRR